MSPGTLAAAVGLHYGDVQSIVNQAVQNAEAGAPEGARIQLEIDSVPGAAALISRINAAFRAGRITNPADGKPIQPWPEYPNEIAFAWQGSNGIMLRWVKLQWQIILIVVLLLVAVAVVYALTRSSWRLMSVSASGGQGAATGPPFVGIQDGTAYFAWLPVEWDAAIAVGLVATPFILRSVAGAIRGAHDVEAAERGG